MSKRRASLPKNNFQNVCRTCLSPTTTRSQSISNNIVIIEILQIITNYKNDDKLPKNICKTCILKINEIRSFVLQCKKTDLKLKENLLHSEKNTKKTEVTSKEDVKVPIAAPEPSEPILEHHEDDDDDEEIHPKEEPSTDRKVGRGKKRRAKFSEQHICKVCSRHFVCKSSLNRHQVLHASKKPFKCPYCGKTFNFLSNLTTHERVHTGSRPYNCKECVRKFTSSTQLKRHVLLHTREKPHVCDVCKKAFTEHTQLKCHKRIHTGEKPYFCPLCERGFRFSSSLIIHNRTHTGEKPYKCKLCFKKFTCNSGLKRHIKIHL